MVLCWRDYVRVGTKGKEEEEKPFLCRSIAHDAHTVREKAHMGPNIVI